MKSISIRFYRTRGNYTKLTRLAAEFALHHIPGPRTEQVIVYLSAPDFTRFLYLWGQVKRRNDTALYFGDTLQTKEQADSILHWISCYANRAFFADEKDYCCITPGLKDLHGWGCKCLHSITRHGDFGRHHGVPWFKVGPHDDKYQYIDKQDIKDKLSAEAEAKGLFLCPMFSIDLAFRFVDQLPNHIVPDDSYKDSRVYRIEQ